MDRQLTVNHFWLLFFAFCIMSYFKNHSRVEDMNHQGVVTYTLPLEALATGIKMESSDHRSSFGANQVWTKNVLEKVGSGSRATGFSSTCYS